MEKGRAALAILFPEKARATSDVNFIVCTLIDNSYEPISAREFGQLLAGPDKLPVLSRNGPQAPVDQRTNNFIHWIHCKSLSGESNVFQLTLLVSSLLNPIQ